MNNLQGQNNNNPNRPFGTRVRNFIRSVNPFRNNQYGQLQEQNNLPPVPHENIDPLARIIGGLPGNRERRNATLARMQHLEQLRQEDLARQMRLEQESQHAPIQPLNPPPHDNPRRPNNQ